MTGREHPDAKLVVDTLVNELRVHVRLKDQGKDFDEAQRRQLAEAIPALRAFTDKTFHAVRAVLDWDHQIPSQYALLRIFACHTPQDTERVDAVLKDREDEITETNLYPEFDVPDYGEIEASESYVALLRPGVVEVEDFRFMSGWRKQVSAATADKAVRSVKGYEGYERVAATRQGEGLGGPVVIGWAPPCLADTDSWAIEVWLLTEFDGQQGKARVFMVDLENENVTREFDTDVQLA